MIRIGHSLSKSHGATNAKGRGRRAATRLCLMGGVVAIAGVVSGSAMLALHNPTSDASAATTGNTKLWADVPTQIEITSIASSSPCDGSTDGKSLCLKWDNTGESASGSQTVTVKTNAPGGYNISASAVTADGKATDMRLNLNGEVGSTKYVPYTCGLEGATSGCSAKVTTANDKGVFDNTHIFDYNVKDKAQYQYQSGTYTGKINYTATVADIAEDSSDYVSICRNADTNSDCAVDIDANMIPIKYAGNPKGSSDAAEWVKADVNARGDWYDYGDQQWANAVTVKPETLATYQSAAAGTEIKNDDILGYYVYIPRYAYEVRRYNASDQAVAPQNFNIRFEKSTDPVSIPVASCTASDEAKSGTKLYELSCTDENGSPTISTQYHGGTLANGQWTGSSWATHPAFTYAGTNANGFWIGKFETTGTKAAPTIKPNQMANINEGITSQFAIAARIGKKNDAIYQMGGISGEAGNAHNLAAAQSHMLNDREWGAASYLSASTYGAGVNNVKNNAAYNHAAGVACTNNDCWSDHDTSKMFNADADGERGSVAAGWYGGRATGCGPTTATDGNSPYTPRTDIQLDATTIENSGVCEKDASDHTHAYNETVGVLASTTGNVYGVYDMAGGNWDRVAAAGGSSVATQASTVGGLAAPYIDVFSKEKGFGAQAAWTVGSSKWTPSSSEFYYNNDNCTWETCGGQALHETKLAEHQVITAWNQSWGSGPSNFPDSGSPWLFRGGGVRNGGASAGLFAASGDYGGGRGHWAFRAALLVAPASE